MNFKTYKKQLNQFLKENIKSYDLPDDADIVLMIQTAAMSDLKIPTYQEKDIPILLIERSCKSTLKKLKVKKLNKLTRDFVNVIIKTIRTGETELIHNFFVKVVMLHIDFMKIMPDLLKIPEFKDIIEKTLKETNIDEELQHQGDKNVSDGKSLDREVQTKKA